MLSGTRPWHGAALALLATLTLTSALFGQALPRSTIVFTDVSAHAGLDDRSFGSPTGHSLGVNWIDVDLDGWPDLFAVGGAADKPPLLLRNLGNGSFEDASSWLPPLPAVEMSGSVFADIDGDGDQDIFIYTDNPLWRTLGEDNPPDGPSSLLLRNLLAETGADPGMPLFEDATTSAGLLDQPAEPLGTLAGYRSKSASFFDYDRDGCMDLFVGHLVLNAHGHPGNRDRLYRNQCDGSFEDVTASLYTQDASPHHRASLVGLGAHLNDDLWPDLYVVNVSALEPGLASMDQMYINQANQLPGSSGLLPPPAFLELASGLSGIGDDAQAGMGADVADVDRDGIWDLYISDLMATEFDEQPLGNVFYRGTATGFADNSALERGVAGADSWGVNFFDADRDGWEDLFVSTIADTPPVELFFRNDGDLSLDPSNGVSFTNVADTAGITTHNSRGSAVADYDRDGDLDLAVVNQNGPLQLFRNDTVTTSHWLGIHLQPADGRSPIGTVVSLVVGPDHQLRQVKGGSSAHSQDDLTVHFGLGATSVVDSLQIHWLSGSTTTLQHLAGARYLEVSEDTLFLGDFETGDTAAWQ